MFLLFHSWKVNLKSLSIPLLVISNTSSVKAYFIYRSYYKTISLATEGSSKYDEPASESNAFTATSTVVDHDNLKTINSSYEDFSEYNVMWLFYRWMSIMKS